MKGGSVSIDKDSILVATANEIAEHTRERFNEKDFQARPDDGG